MLDLFQQAIDGLIGRIGYDANSLCKRIGGLADEDDFTSRLAQDIERSISRKQIGSVKFTVLTKRLKWRGEHSEEWALGADLMLVMRMHAGVFDVSKGYLIQAKMNSRSSSNKIRVANPQRLSKQIDDMLRFTSDAYVWAYSKAGIAVAKAVHFGQRWPVRAVSSLMRNLLLAFFEMLSVHVRAITAFRREQMLS
jgi:hypothetical protein